MAYQTEQRQQHQLLFLISFITLGLVVFTFVFQNAFYYTTGLKYYISLHLLFEFFIIFFSFAIATQTWLGSMFHPDYKHILIGALFLAVGILEGAHAISYSGMPFFLTDLTPNGSVWFTTIQRLLIPIGFIVIYSLKERKVVSKFSNTVFLGSLISSLVLVLLFYTQTIDLPILITPDGDSTLTKNVLHVLFMVLNMLAIIIIWNKRATITHNVPLLMFALAYLMLSELMYFMYQRLFDVFIFSAHVFHLTSFALLFFAIYYSQVRIPFIEMSKAHQSLEASKQELQKIAYYDNATGLQNEQFLKEDLQNDLQGDNTKALIVFNIDRFTQLKSSLGKAQIVTLMKQISKRITKVLDNPFNFYMLDSDRFIIYLNDVQDEAEIIQLTTLIQSAMEEPLSLSHFSININFRFGVSIYPKDATTGEGLIQNAVFALYEAEHVKNAISFFNPEMQKMREERIKFENDLKYALNGEMFLEYQPQLDFKTGELSSMEALLRWRHPEKGIISPFHFIPIAEETGLIVPIGQWVLEKACLETMALQEKLGKPIRVAVNLSIGQLYQEDFVEVVARVLHETGMKPKYLQLEITESMSENIQLIIPILKELKALGVTIAMDDFGTGYSSLSYLKEFPIDVLKIDRSFVWNILESEKDEALVRMIISMAKHLGLQIVAEGIESVAQLRYLNDHQCDKIQGYLISKPMTFEKLQANYNQLQAFANEQIIEIKQMT